MPFGYTGGYPLGASVYVGAVSSIEAVEQIQRSLAAEFTLGRKRLLLPPYMTEQDEQGKPVFDTIDIVFCSPPGKDTTFPADLSTPLRAEEHSAALAAATEFLRIACGLGKTPAEELALLRTYRARFAEMLTEMVVSTARLLGQLEPKRVDILFDSLPFSERIAANAALVRDGLRFKVSALSDLLGCSDTAAKKELEKVTAQAVERAGAYCITSSGYLIFVGGDLLIDFEKLACRACGIIDQRVFSFWNNNFCCSNALAALKHSGSTSKAAPNRSAPL